jgi:hypothetical protein
VAVVAYQAPPPPGFALGDATVTRSGSIIRVVVPVTSFTGVPPPYSSREVALGQLGTGSYTVELIGRYGDGREELLVSRPLMVTEIARCGPPTLLQVTRGSFQTTSPGQPFPEGLEVLLRDADGRPLEGEEVFLVRMFSQARNDVIPGASRAVTGPDGVARFGAIAGTLVGSVQYKARLVRPDRELAAYFVLSVRPFGTATTVEPAIEYVNTRLFHFFLTSSREEMRKLDSGEWSDWQRTGGVFLVYPNGSAGGASPVCRYYLLPVSGSDSHFFSASKQECDAVAAKFGSSWLLETNEAFRLELPDPIYGQCDSDFLPVYRTLKQDGQPNHRYTTEYELSTLFSDWIKEGYGPYGVAMCSPK